VCKGETPVLIVPARGKPYLLQPRDWSRELSVFLEVEARAAEPRLSPERISHYREFVDRNTAYRALAAAQLEATGWIKEGSDGLW
jgi:hypothetical protein